MGDVALLERTELYRATRTPALVRVPPLSFAMVDGHGDPNTSAEYAAAVQAVYGLSWTLKFMLKSEQGLTNKVGPLEGLWWSDSPEAFATGPGPDWCWTTLIAQPDEVTPDLFERARGEVERKRGPSEALTQARLETYDEGLCGQVLHVGPFSAEGPTIMRLHTFIHDHGLVFDGRHQKHHEIYLSDVRRAAPERWRTILRQPASDAPPVA